MPHRRRAGVTAATSELLGVPVGVAVPLHRHPPAVVLAVGIAEIAALVALVVTASVAALAALAGLAVALVGLGATNRRRILAISSTDVLLLVASARGRPLAPIGPAPGDLTLPAPAGLAVPVVLADGRWWVDRVDFPRAARARDLLGGDRGAGDRGATGVG